MTHWEFLIQKEGDRPWFPIQETTIEIEPGKYRLVAHSDRVNTKVEIRITHQTSGNFQKYARRTNLEGLLIILPLTYLEPGIWELRCCGDILSDLLGYPWQERVQLHVLSQVETRKNHPVPLENDAVEKPFLNTFSSSTKAEHYRQQLEQVLRQEIEPLLLVSASTSLAQTVQLSLEQDTFIRSRGELVSITGQIHYLEFNKVSNSAFQGRLRYVLCEPKTEQILLSVEQFFSQQTLPIIFCYTLEIPRQCERSFLLGEVFLETFSQAFLENQIVIVARCPFTIATDLTPLLLETEEDLSCTLKALLAQEKNSSALHLDLPEPTKMAKTLQLFPSASEQILPPRIARVSSPEKVVKPLQLPQFFLPSLPANIPNEPTTNSTVEMPAVELLPVREIVAVANEQVSLVEHSFQSLKLEERFLLRLNSLAVESESLVFSNHEVVLSDENPK